MLVGAWNGGGGGGRWTCYASSWAQGTGGKTALQMGGGQKQRQQKQKQKQKQQIGGGWRGRRSTRRSGGGGAAAMSSKAAAGGGGGGGGGRKGEKEEKGEEEEERYGVVIVGAGLAGLAAAAALAEGAGRVALAEAADDVGGRVRTDVVRGFQLDRGFQILITAYPEARRLLDYGALELRDFYAGALVWARDGRFHRVADPLRHPLHALLSLFDPVVGSVADKLLVGLVRALTVARPDSALLSDPDEEPIASRLRSLGFSPAFVDAFFRPFLAGIFFDPLLRTSSRLFSFVFKCLALGPSALPARGIAAVPRHLARRLPASTSILLRSRVARLLVAADADAAGHPHDPDRVVGVELEDGRRLLCSHGVILATDGPEAWNLLRRAAIAGTPPPPPSLAKPPRSTVCIYFEADADPARRLSPALTEPILLLNGSGNGIVNNMFFPTSVSPSYAPPGKILASVSLVGLYDDRTDAELEATVRDELADWLGADVVASWTHLRTYRIRFAQPDQSPPTDLLQDTRLSPGLYVCGDHRYSATFDGALASGRRAAQDLLADLDRNPPS